MIKKFLGDSSLYVLANIFTKGIAFFMLPLYVSYLSKEEYGIFDYIITIGSFLGVCISLEISQSVIRFSSENNDNTDLQFKYISNGLWFICISYSIFIFICLFLLNSLSSFITGKPDNTLLVILALISYFSSVLIYYITVVYRSMLNPKAATISSAISAALTALFSLLFIYLHLFKLETLLIGLITAQLLVAITNLYSMRNKLIFKIDFVLLKNMLQFSLPLVISSLGVVLSLFVDRIMIKQLLSFEDLAIYGVAARFASLVGLLVMGFQSALAPLIYSNLNQTNLHRDLRKLFFGYLLITSGLIAFLFISARSLINLIIGSSYSESAIILPYLALAVALQSAIMFFPGLSIVKKTYILAAINIFTGLLNIYLNYIMLPKFGLIGAAYSTLITAFIYFLINSFFSEKYFPIITK